MLFDKFSARDPIIWLAVVVGVFCLIVKSPSEPKLLPKKIHPPSLKDAAWTVFYRSTKSKTQFSLDLESRYKNDGYVTIWVRFDDFGKGNTILTLTRYDCEFGKRSDIYDVHYENGAYYSYSEYDKDDLSKVDLETIEGSEFLLACYDKMPGLIDND